MAAARKVITAASGPPDHVVRLMEESPLEYPQLYMDVYVEGDSFEQQAFAKMFVNSACKKAKSPLDADLVVFTGGVDVNPSLYGALHHTSTFHSEGRDKRDMDVWDMCVANGIPMLGICRGAQFGWVMSGGKLYQDVDNHNSDHDMYDLRMKKRIPVSSVHHQMIMPDPNIKSVILGDSSQARVRHIDPFDKVIGQKFDIEAFWLPDVGFLGIQGHPEYAGYDEFKMWTLKCIHDLIWSNPDLYLEKESNCRRFTKEHRDLARLEKLKVKKGMN